MVNYIMFVLILVIVLEGAIGTTPPGIDAHKSAVADGVLFSPMGTLTISKSIHVTFMEINIGIIIRNLKTISHALHSYLDHPTFQHLPRVIQHDTRHMRDQLHHSQDLLRSILESSRIHRFQPLPSTRRRRRGLINAIGKTSNFLFGTATEDQIIHLNNQIVNISKSEKSIAETLNKHTSILRKFSPAIDAIQKDLGTIHTVIANYNDIHTEVSMKDNLQFLFL